MQIHVLVLQGCTPMVPIGFADLFRKAAGIGALVPGLEVRDDVNVSLVSATRQVAVTAAGGIKLRCDTTIHETRRGDLVMVPAIDPDVEANLARNRDVVPWLRRMALAGADVASACTGSFALAEAGLLSQRRATTHWAFAELFRKRYPTVSLEPDAVVVDQGRVLTSGGATSFLTLAIYVVERVYGPDVARAASKFFLIDVNKPLQSAYVAFHGQKAHGDGDVLRAQNMIEHSLRRDVSVDDLARGVGMSRRNFCRRFKAATGNVPREYVQRVRIEAAKRALEARTQPIAEIARAVGYEDVVTFRKLFQRWVGLTPSAYRERYGPRTVPSVIVQTERVARSFAARR